MSRTVDPFSKSEDERLTIRAQKFLDFAFKGKKSPSKKVKESLKIMLAGEYQRGYRAKNGHHFKPPKEIVVQQDLTRLQHFKKAVWK